MPSNGRPVPYSPATWIHVYLAPRLEAEWTAWSERKRQVLLQISAILAVATAETCLEHPLENGQFQFQFSQSRIEISIEEADGRICVEILAFDYSDPSPSSPGPSGGGGIRPRSISSLHLLLRSSLNGYDLIDFCGNMPSIPATNMGNNPSIVSRSAACFSALILANSVFSRSSGRASDDVSASVSRETRLNKAQKMAAPNLGSTMPHFAVAPSVTRMHLDRIVDIPEIGEPGNIDCCFLGDIPIPDGAPIASVIEKEIGIPIPDDFSDGEWSYVPIGILRRGAVPILNPIAICISPSSRSHLAQLH